MSQEEELKQAIALIKAGNKNEAVPTLKGILKENRNVELAWLWLSVCTDKPDEKIFCFQQALRINPNNEHAKKALEKIPTQPTPEPIPEITREIPEDIRSKVETKRTWIEGYESCFVLMSVVMIVSICLCLIGIILYKTFSGFTLI